MMQQIDRVRQLLSEVKPILQARRAELGPLLKALGQSVFEEPRATLSEQELAQYEVTHALILPEDYRLFLKTIGNGGPGPGYGMSELSPPFPETIRNRRSIPADQVNHLVVIVALGCGMSWDLVVHGPDRGNIWYYDEDGDVPSDPKCRFLDWYEGWLRNTLQQGKIAPGP